MRLITALFSIIAITAVNAQVPIPTRPPGFALGGPASAPIVLEAFFDLMCPDSAAAWPTIQQVVTHYNTNLHFLLHTFPLPYHTNSFFANQGAFVVSQTNASNVFTWTTAVFQNQEQFSNGATAGSAINDVISSMGDLAAKTGLISKSAFISGIGNADINWSQRVEWKYGCTRGVAGTPTFFVNGVEVAASASWSLADWQSVLDPLVPTHRRHHKHVTEATNKALFACPSGEPQCQYLPGKFECCLPGEGCIPNVGCRC